MTVAKFISETLNLSKVDNSQSATRSYIAYTRDREAALLADGLPSLLPGTRHPDYPSMVIQSVSPRLDGAIYRIDIQYANRTGSAGGGNTTTNPDDLNDHLWGWGMRVAEFIIPAQQKVVNKIAKPDDTVAIKETWQFLQKPPTIQRRFIRRILRISGIEVVNSNAFDAIYEQAEKLHRIRGKQYLFVGGEVDNGGSGNVYSVTYTWEFDKGIRLPSGLFVGNNECLILKPDTAGPPGWSDPDASGCEGFLLPYHKLVSRASSDPEVEPNAIDQKLFYGIDDDGWRSLPGVGALA